MIVIIKRARRLLREPHRLPERLSERRMNRAALTFYAQRTFEENAREREAFFRPFIDSQDLEGLLNEARALPTYQQILNSHSSDDPALKIAASQTTSPDDCLTMYVMVRVWQPKVMVETGVFYGAMSAMILHAMHQNGFGRLYSIDLPIESDGLPAEIRGALVPNILRDRWKLILGNSLQELPRLLQKLGQIDAFNHDSLHTTRHMLWEYTTVWPYLKSGGCLSSHDVLTTPAWQRFCKKHTAEISTNGQVYGIGMALKR